MATKKSQDKPADTRWQSALPSDCGPVREIGDQAIWSLSSRKAGYGVDQLLDNSIDTYWQSDGPQPHLVNIQFSKKTPVSFLLMYIDFKSDESYTPGKILVRVGSSLSDLKEVKTVEFHEPIGWQLADLRSNNGDDVVCGGDDGWIDCFSVAQSIPILPLSGVPLDVGVKSAHILGTRPIKAFVVQLAVIQNHQNGRDTHIRQVKIVGPSFASTDQLRQPLVAAERDAPTIPPKFLTVDMNQFATIR